MNGNEALRELERRMIPVRGIAGANEAWEAYRASEVPASLDPTRETAMRQGFDAGYDAAMASFRRVLTATQNMALAPALGGASDPILG